MNRKTFRLFAWLVPISMVGLFAGFAIRDFDFEQNVGVSVGSLLLIFLVVTYVPLVYLFWKKKRSGSS